jgi:uncharacterized Zn-binding protein involved in type VI secretion
MPGQGRLGDKAHADADAHGCPGCPHPTVGPAISGSADVFVNGRPALRVDDVGIHAACCGPNQWRAQEGSSTVFINGKPAHRVDDHVQHCGGAGQLVEGSDNVIVGGPPTAVGQPASANGKSASLAIRLRDERGRPLGGVRYKVTGSDGQVVEGALDASGAATVTPLADGKCRVQFPELDG